MFPLLALLLDSALTSREVWENVAKGAAAPLLLLVLARVLNRRDKKKDETTLILKARNNKADAERETIKDDVKALKGRLDKQELYSTRFQQADEKFQDEVHQVRNELAVVLKQVSRNELNIDNARSAAARIEAQVNSIIQRLLDR